MVLILLCSFYRVPAQPVRWDGGGGDSRWANPLNWESDTLPGPASDVLLDQSLRPGSYEVWLPGGDTLVEVRSLQVLPVLPDSIFVFLPASSQALPAFRALGPADGLLLGKAAVFRNGSGISSGTALEVADSIRILNGGQYIHACRGSHASSVVQILASAPGTEEGIFIFDIPGASSTLSLSNRRFGRLRLQSESNGGSVTYTASGTRPLHLADNLEIGHGVRFSLNFSDTLFVEGDFIQEGGECNLANATRAATLSVAGSVIQFPGSQLLRSGTAQACLLLRGGQAQKLEMRGSIGTGIWMRVNNAAGLWLASDLRWRGQIDLRQGILRTSADNMLILDSAAYCTADSLSNLSFIQGPLRKEGLSGDDFFIPVGDASGMRWISLKRATGAFRVEYRRQSPYDLGGSIGPGIDHLSHLEYWRLEADSQAGLQAAVELSFDNVNSGGVTDLQHLLICGREEGGATWASLGRQSVTGTAGSHGSVTAMDTLFSAGTVMNLCLGSDLPAANPLPLADLQFLARADGDFLYFTWQAGMDLQADSFSIEALTENGSRAELHRQEAQAGLLRYALKLQRPGWKFRQVRLKMRTRSGQWVYSSWAVVRELAAVLQLERWRYVGGTGRLQIVLRAPEAGPLRIWISDLNGRILFTREQQVVPGRQTLDLQVPALPRAVYLLGMGTSRGLRLVKAVMPED